MLKELNIPIYIYFNNLISLLEILSVFSYILKYCICIILLGQ